jgi:hypothetical protein
MIVGNTKGKQRLETWRKWLELKYVNPGNTLDVKYLVEISIEANRLGLDVVKILPETCRNGNVSAITVNRITDWVAKHAQRTSTWAV